MKNNFDNTELNQSLKTLGLILLSIIAALLVGSILIAIVGVNPLEAYKYMIIKPFTTKMGIGEILTKAIPLVIVGVGVAFAAIGGANNLGGEGQMWVGALGATIIATTGFGKSLGWFGLPVGMLVGVIFGIIWGGFAGYMKAYYGSNELIVTLMLNYIAVQLVAYMVHGPLMEYGGVNPQSEAIAEVMRLPKLWRGTRAHYGLLIAVVCVLIYWFVKKYTRFGYNLRVVGKSPKAARFAGNNIKFYQLIAMVIAGGFAGLAGSIEVFGVQYRLLEGIIGSMGITGMVVALIGRLNPAGIVASAVMMATLSAGAEKMQVAVGVPVTLVDILQGMIVLFILVSLSFQGRGGIKVKKAKGGKTNA